MSINDDLDRPLYEADKKAFAAAMKKSAKVIASICSADVVAEAIEDRLHSLNIAPSIFEKLSETDKCDLLMMEPSTLKRAFQIASRKGKPATVIELQNICMLLRKDLIFSLG